MSTLYSAVPKAWLAERGFAPEDVALYRYDNGTWVLLPTARNADADGDDAYHFVSFSHNISTVFAVAAEDEVPGPTVEPTAVPTETPVETPTGTQTIAAGAAEPTPPESPLPLWPVVIAVLGAVYVFAKRRA